MQTHRAINWVEQGYVPDSIIRKGIRRLLKQRLNEIDADNTEAASIEKSTFIEKMSNNSIALLTDKANEQHYEVPAEFYEIVLGQHSKYSCGYWKPECTSLDQAEADALELTCKHADISNGQNILELGCGWGSLTLWMAAKYPDSQITAVSNSHSQRLHIQNKAKASALKNVNVITCDMNEFESDLTFDRIVSVEMFEHMRNWKILYNKISQWLKDDGLFFMHVFSHRQIPYTFEVKDQTDWMSKYFFSGGMMPSDDLPLYFQDDLKIMNNWTWDGKHYARTCNEWLKRMDANSSEIMPILKNTYGENNTQTWWMRWRLFFMACAELFAYDNGQQWHVMHYLFSKR